MSAKPVVLLHIGRNKTGTTAIQSALRASPDWLAERGWRYGSVGRRGVGHADLAVALRKSVNRGRDLDIARIVDEASTEVRQAGPGRRLIYSAESFQRTDRPARVASVIPPDRTHVVAYVREQYAYAQSSYCQDVRWGRTTADFESYLTSFSPDYPAFLRGWRDGYGPARLTVRPYDRRQLKAGNVVDDFLEVAGIPDADLTRPAEDANVAMGGPLLTFARLLYAADVVPRDLRKKMVISMKQLAAARPELQQKPWAPPTVVAAYRGRFVQDNALLGREYLAGGSLTTDMTPHEDPSPAADAAALAAIWSTLMQSRMKLWAPVATAVKAAAPDSADARRLAEALPI